MHLISTSVKIGNEMDNLSMCAKFHLIVQRLTPALVDLFFGPYDSVSLRVMRRIVKLCDGLLLYRANRKTKQSNCMQYSVCSELHINMLFSSFQATK